MKKSLLLITLLLASGLARGADLLTVYEAAARNNPTLAAAAANLEAVRENRPQAMAGLRNRCCITTAGLP